MFIFFKWYQRIILLIRHYKNMGYIDETIYNKKCNGNRHRIYVVFFYWLRDRHNIA